MGVIGFLECLLLVLATSCLCLPESGMDRFYMVQIGVLSCFAQVGLVVTAQLESAGTTALLRKAFDVLFAFLLQITLFKVSDFTLVF